VMKLMERFPWLIIAGGGLLGYLAGEIATHDSVVKSWIDANAPSLHWMVPMVGIALVVAVGMRLVRRRRKAAPS
jgi:predicted tellurium resistance membrane protein TerC